MTVATLLMNINVVFSSLPSLGKQVLLGFSKQFRVVSRVPVVSVLVSVPVSVPVPVPVWWGDGLVDSDIADLKEIKTLKHLALLYRKCIFIRFYSTTHCCSCNMKFCSNLNESNVRPPWNFDSEPVMKKLTLPLLPCTLYLVPLPCSICMMFRSV